jgi:parallel beta-helix repeat protein
LKKLAVSLLILLLLVMFYDTGIAQPSSASIIRICPDGSVQGTDKIQRNGNIYTLTGDLHSYVGSEEAFIFVEKDNIIFDGAGYTIRGAGHGSAIYMMRRQSVTLKNFNIVDFEVGVNFWTARNWPPDSKFWGLPAGSDNKILDNNITVTKGNSMDSGWAIYLQEAVGTLISGNILTSLESKNGIYFGWTTEQTELINNKFVGCGLYLKSSSQTIGKGNTVDDKPLILLDGESNIVVEEAGLVYLFNCENITIRNLVVSVDYGQTIQLYATRNSQVMNCEGYITLINSNNNSILQNNPKRIELSNSSYNQVFANTIKDSGVCITLYASSDNNQIFENTLLDSKNSKEAQILHMSGKNPVGIRLGDGQMGGCQYNNIFQNKIINHGVGIEIYSSSNNNFFSNMISESNVGVSLGGSNNNIFSQNSFAGCGYAFTIRGSHNLFYENNFKNNDNQVSIRHTTLFGTDIIIEYSTNNTFNHDQRLVGNYWSDYTLRYPDAKELDGLGVWDTPYVIDENTRDKYPLIDAVEIIGFSDEDSAITPIEEKPSILIMSLVVIFIVVFSGVLVYFFKEQV